MQVFNVTSPVNYVLNLILKSTLLSKETFLLVMFEWRFHIKGLGDISKITLNVTVIYHLTIWHVARKHHCICILFPNALSRFHYNVLFCCEIFCTNSCWKLFKLQEALVSFKTATKHQKKLDTPYFTIYTVIKTFS